ncbi:hypothetical protein LCGC14_0413190 [marine sediment metagenome]|uniref:Uncharacterized protein n=1 Tax=marine sediment metagenome TaxID=412755 RepID=A0A0F9TB43_9ZZZZ
MASTVKTNSFSGGAAVQPGGSAGKDDLATMLRDAVDDVTELRTQLIAFFAKLDTDFAAQNGVVTSSQLDVDYESVLTPAAQALTKG